jgi:predicted enzyme related to lactoylglutathione lyase
VQILVNIDVDDLERAQAFYLAAFDLKLGRRLGPDVVELLGRSSPINMLRKAAGTAPAPPTVQRRDYQRHWSPVHLDFVVADLDAAVQRVLAAGATPELPAMDFAWGRLATFADPFGHGLCLLQFTGRGYDAIAV